MKRNKKQLKKLILEALKSGSDVINKNAVARKADIGYKSSCRYIDEVYEKFIKNKTY